MIDHALLQSVAEQMMTSAAVNVEGKTCPVKRTGTNHFRTVKFTMHGAEYQAIEQNPEKPSRWAQLARSGKKVVQFRDFTSGNYIAVSVEGKITEYTRK